MEILKLNNSEATHANLILNARSTVLYGMLSGSSLHRLVIVGPTGTRFQQGMNACRDYGRGGSLGGLYLATGLGDGRI